jgi:serine/threonine protein kinase
LVYKAQGSLDGIAYAIKRSGKKSETLEEKSAILREVTIIATSPLLTSTAFLSQVQALASLSDDSDAMSCIVRYYNSWFEEDHLCIQMELCDSSAADIYEPLTPTLSYRLLRDILNALDVLHR